jgi:hypothetical protein
MRRASRRFTIGSRGGATWPAPFSGSTADRTGTGSLPRRFVAGYQTDEPDVRPALQRFATSILEQDFRAVGMPRLTRGFRHLFSRPALGGACKALASLPPLDGPPVAT